MNIILFYKQKNEYTYFAPDTYYEFASELRFDKKKMVKRKTLYFILFVSTVPNLILKISLH